MAKKKAVKKSVNTPNPKESMRTLDILIRNVEILCERTYRIEEEQKKQSLYYSKLFAAQETVISELSSAFKELRNLPEAVLTIATEARKNHEKLEGALGQLSEQLPLHYSAVAHPDSTVIIATLQERIKEMSRGVDEQFLQFAIQVKEKWDNLQNRMVSVERFFDMGGPITPKPDGTERTTEPPISVEYLGTKYYRTLEIAEERAGIEEFGGG